MKLNIKAAAISMGLIWGLLGMGLIGLMRFVWPGYAQNLFDLVASIYPGFKVEPSIGNLIIGTAYGIVDGGVFGALFAWLYNRVVSCGTQSSTTSSAGS